MKFQYRELPNGETKTVEGTDIRPFMRRALSQVTQDLRDLRDEHPKMAAGLTAQMHKMRRRAVDRLQMGQPICTRINSDGYPDGGMEILPLVKIDSVIMPDGTKVKT